MFTSVNSFQFVFICKFFKGFHHLKNENLKKKRKMKTFIKKLFGKNKKNEIININIKRYEIEIKNDDGINIFITNE